MITNYILYEKYLIFFVGNAHRESPIVCLHFAGRKYTNVKETTKLVFTL